MDRRTSQQSPRTDDRPHHEELVTLYLHAKDENRPHLMARAFAPQATLEMLVKTDLIAFPAKVQGLDAITDVLVRQFGRTCENVYTFCLWNEHRHDAPGRLSCDWMVGMSLKDGGELRVGCGRYDWKFQSTPPYRVEGLRITIERMQLLESHQVQPVMGWLSGLPYPWCAAEFAAERAPALEALAPMLRYITRSTSEG